MMNILRLCAMDFRALGKNVIALIVTVGLVLIPPMYAWFTTAGFWDPYGNTGNIKVAVANNDEGYQSSLLPMKINAGETVVSKLRANDQFDWEFMSEEEALDQLRAGECYAAIVIPQSFSADLMTVLSRETKTADILYYTNQRENAIAPRVTSAGATALETQVDEAFTETVSSVALGMTSDLSSFLSGEGIESYGNALLSQLDQVIDQLGNASAEARTFATLSGSTADLAATSAKILESLGSTTSNVAPLLDEAETALQSGSSALEDSEKLANEAFDQASQAFSGLSDKVNAALDSVGGVDDSAAGTLTAAAQDLDSLKTVYQQLRDAVATADPASPVIGRLDSAQAALGTLSSDLQSAASAVGQQKDSLQAQREKVQASLTKAKDSLAAAHDAYNGQLSTDLTSLGDALSRARETSSTLAAQIDSTAKGLADASSSLSENLASVQEALGQTADKLDASAANMKSSREQLAAALASGDMDKVRQMLGDDPGRIAEFLSAPTQLVRHAVYPMANNGTAMSPFYTSLSLWIGALFAVVLTQVQVSPKVLAKLKKPTANQTFLGRFGVFWLIGSLQALIVCLGNVFFLGIQVQHLGLYLLSGLVVALVFQAIVYTLTVSFGNIGKAIAIIALVAQLAGTGGILPVQLSAPFFQAIYPWLPMTYAMNAFQSTIAGIYGNQLTVDLLCLLAWLVPCLILGLVLRHPVIRLNNFILKKLDETKLV
ncbi:MAG: YhgE/Pip domain-containing protein [Eggerthellaceae bacterium]|nr:YhgE/Pip domain-containing protein [Eggerthellaceae bacterium]